MCANLLNLLENDKCSSLEDKTPKTIKKNSMNNDFLPQAQFPFRFHPQLKKRLITTITNSLPRPVAQE